MAGYSSIRGKGFQNISVRRFTQNTTKMGNVMIAIVDATIVRPSVWSAQRFTVSSKTQQM